MESTDLLHGEGDVPEGGVFDFVNCTVEAVIVLPSQIFAA
jgi:hypothetical protein